MHKSEMILIDVDGTLVDSVPDLACCVDTMMVVLDRALMVRRVCVSGLAMVSSAWCAAR